MQLQWPHGCFFAGRRILLVLLLSLDSIRRCVCTPCIRLNAVGAFDVSRVPAASLPIALACFLPPSCTHCFFFPACVVSLASLCCHSRFLVALVDRLRSSFWSPPLLVRLLPSFDSHPLCCVPYCRWSCVGPCFARLPLPCRKGVPLWICVCWVLPGILLTFCYFVVVVVSSASFLCFFW